MAWNDCGRGGREGADAHNAKMSEIARRGSARHAEATSGSSGHRATARDTIRAADAEIRRIDNEAHRKGWW